jgi:YVTN family beta-propeller protein
MLRLLVFLACATPAFAQLSHFEARLTHPIALTPDGKTLLALNTPDSSLSLFDVSDSSRAEPFLIGEIPVGIEPVSVRARTNGEAWVVNEVSDSISVVSLADGSTLATLQVPDEPADVYFAAGKAFVTCSGNRQMRVFDAVTRAPLATLPLNGIAPRALTGSADGSKIYAAFLLSGNGSTILPRTLAPAQPAPSNSSLPAAPRTALIVAGNDSRISWNVQDQDIAEIDTTTLQVTRTFTGIGTHLFDMQVHPGTGKLWVANSDSLNLTRFEPQLNGHFSIHRLTQLTLSGPTNPSHFDLNTGIPRATTPAPASIAQALAQPTGLAFSGDGSRAWVSAFNSDRVAEIDTSTGEILGRIDVRTPHPQGLTNNSRFMRGPRGLAISNISPRLYVLNKLSNSITIIHTGIRSVLAEIPTGSHDPTRTTIRQGRGFLFDARLSGNGTVSCATCHLDADRDGLAWDLGNPGGAMVTVKGANLSAHLTTLVNRSMHPMKGPMVTQTLRGLATNDSSVTTPAAAVTTKFHWRGDMPSIQSFNTTFPNLLGGNLIAAADMDAMAAYLLTIRHHPNPNRNLDRTLPTSFQGGNAVAGRDLFNDHLASHCGTCHALPSGTDQNVDLKREVDGSQEMKNPPLRTVYQRAGLFNPIAGQPSLSGFGLGADGTGSSLPLPHFYQLDNINTDQQRKDLAAFLLCFDTGTAPSVGKTLTFQAGEIATHATELGILETQALAAACDLVVRVKVDGRTRSFRYQPSSGTYRPDRSSEPALTRSALLAFAGKQPLTFSGVIPGDGPRLGGDLDLDGVLDGDEPVPTLQLQATADSLILTWPSNFKDWFPQSATHPAGPWTPWSVTNSLPSPLPSDRTRFFRLHHTR